MERAIPNLLYSTKVCLCNDPVSFPQPARFDPARFGRGEFGEHGSLNPTLTLILNLTSP